MKGNEKLIETLNTLLSEELTAISQYMVHSEMAESWGYAKLHAHFDRQAKDEMKHAEKLIERILFLEGTPIVSKLLPMHIGADVPKQLASDHDLELFAVKEYNNAITRAADAGDNATKEILEAILRDEDRHVDAIEERLDQIQHMGIQIFLSTQSA
jgi:bacterioferritin